MTVKRAALFLTAALLSFAARDLRADGPADAPRAAAPDSPNSSEATAAPKPARNAFDPHLASSTEASGPGSGSQDGFFRSWLKRVARTQAEQPHWITPVVTVTPRLEQEFRYDISQQTQPNGTTILRNFGGSKGLEIIPTEHAELIFSPPPFITRSFNGVPDGDGDVSFLLQYRFLSANEEAGNYIFTAFLGGAIPKGSRTNGARDATVAPTPAAGKCCGEFAATRALRGVLPTPDSNPPRPPTCRPH